MADSTWHRQGLGPPNQEAASGKRQWGAMRCTPRAGVVVQQQAAAAQTIAALVGNFLLGQKEQRSVALLRRQAQGTLSPWLLFLHTGLLKKHHPSKKLRRGRNTLIGLILCLSKQSRLFSVNPGHLVFTDLLIWKSVWTGTCEVEQAVNFLHHPYLFGTFLPQQLSY